MEKLSHFGFWVTVAFFLSLLSSSQDDNYWKEAELHSFARRRTSQSNSEKKYYRHCGQLWNPMHFFAAVSIFHTSISFGHWWKIKKIVKYDIMRRFHGVWKSQKKVSFNIASEASYLYTLRIHFKIVTNDGQFGEILKIWSLKSSSVTR